MLGWRSAPFQGAACHDRTRQALPTMSDNLPVPASPSGSGIPAVFGPSDETIVRFQGEIESLMTPALRTLHELCEMADSEGVRLNAATSILFFAGMRPHKRRYAPATDEAAQAEGTGRELALLLERLDRNHPGIMAEVQEAARDEVARDQVVDAEVVED